MYLQRDAAEESVVPLARFSADGDHPLLEDRNMTGEMATWGPQSSAYERSLTFFTDVTTRCRGVQQRRDVVRSKHLHV